MEYVGIDLHKKESQICLLTEAGDVMERRIRTEPQRLPVNCAHGVSRRHASAHREQTSRQGRARRVRLMRRAVAGTRSNDSGSSARKGVGGRVPLRHHRILA